MIMDSIKGYKTRFEIKDKNLYCRMDSSMIQRLKEIRKATGISVSEVIRESVRRLIQEVDDTGSINLRVN
jgi:predicted DNA-binding protein